MSMIKLTLCAVLCSLSGCVDRPTDDTTDPPEVEALTSSQCEDDCNANYALDVADCLELVGNSKAICLAGARRSLQLCLADCE